MNPEDVRFNRWLCFPIAGSFVAFAVVVILRLGLGATSYTNTDSLGRPMGFNDPLYLEHYLIMISNFQATELLELKYAYEWLLAAAHLFGAGLLLAGTRVASRLVRWYFAVQWILFPFGLVAVFFLPLLAVGIVSGRPMDQEGFVDLPFIIMIAHPIWLLTSLYITFAMRARVLV